MSATQCNAITKKGTHCRNLRVNGSAFCHIHSRDEVLDKQVQDVGTLSSKDIETIISWNDERNPPFICPIGKRALTNDDIKWIVKAWREKHGRPEIPKKEFWQWKGVRWKQGPNLAGLDLSGRDSTDMDVDVIILAYADLEKSCFDRASLVGAWLKRANFRRTRFEGANLTNARFFEADLTEAEFWTANLSNVSFRGAILERTRLLEANLDGAYFHRARLNNTEMFASQLGDSIGEERDCKYFAAGEAYTRLKANFQSIGRYADAGWAYRKERRMRKKWTCVAANKTLKDRKLFKALRLWGQWISNWFVEILCDYGESVWRVVGWMTAVLFVFGPLLVFLCGGIEFPNLTEISGAKLPLWKSWLYAYLHYLLYMIDTFTTADFSKAEPRNDTVRVASGLMSLLAIFLTGLLGFVAGNRIRNT